MWTALLVTLAPLGVVAATSPAPNSTVVLDDTILIPVPIGFEAEETRVGDKARLVTLSDEDSVLAVMVYNTRTPPPSQRALVVHAARLKEAAGAYLAKTRHTFFGKYRPARELRFVQGGAARVARVVSARAAGKTVVATWMVSASERIGKHPLTDAVTRIATRR